MFMNENQSIANEFLNNYHDKLEKSSNQVLDIINKEGYIDKSNLIKIFGEFLLNMKVCDCKTSYSLSEDKILKIGTMVLYYNNIYFVVGDNRENCKVENHKYVGLKYYLVARYETSVENCIMAGFEDVLYFN